jgi:hypothetical protein
MSNKQIIKRLYELRLELENSTSVSNGPLLKEYFDLKKQLSKKFKDL